MYLVDFSNVGGLVMPLVLEIELKSGKKYIERVPAEVWRYSPKKITKLIVTDEPMVGLTQDPYWETADIDTSNNAWPRKLTQSRVELFKTERDRNNLMRDFNTPLKIRKIIGRPKRRKRRRRMMRRASVIVCTQVGGRRAAFARRRRAPIIFTWE